MAKQSRLNFGIRVELAGAFLTMRHLARWTRAEPVFALSYPRILDSRQTAAAHACFAIFSRVS
jgi:hypothetical protein